MGYNVTISGVEYEGIDKVQLPLTDGSGRVTFIADASLEEFVVGNIISFESDIEELARAYAFYGQLKLESVSFPNLKGIAGYTFMDCTALKTVNLPVVDTFKAGDVFSGCKVLEEINLPKLTAITAKAFNNCSSLKKADFPVVKSIAASAFNNNTALETLILRSETMCTLANVNAFLGTPIAAGTASDTCFIYVPSVLVDSYKVATNWSTFANQFRAIEDYPSICG